MIVAFCDDDEKIISIYEKRLKEIIKEEKLEVTFLRYSSGENLLFEIDGNANTFDILYLDIEMGAMNGIETAQLLREKGCHAEIIFLTACEEYVFQAFDVMPLHYLLKDDYRSEQFKTVFLKAFECKRKKDNENFFCEFDDHTKVIPLVDISYFEIQNRMITVHFLNETYSFYQTMEELCAILNEQRFIRIHRSFVIQISYIDEIYRKTVKLRCGVELPIGPTYADKVRDAFAEYLLSI